VGRCPKKDPSTPGKRGGGDYRENPRRGQGTTTFKETLKSGQIYKADASERGKRGWLTELREETKAFFGREEGS